MESKSQVYSENSTILLTPLRTKSRLDVLSPATRSDYLLKHTRVHRKTDSQQTTASLENHQDEPAEEDVNALLSEAMLHDDVGLASLESATESMELVLDPGSTTPQRHC